MYKQKIPNTCHRTSFVTKNNGNLLLTYELAYMYVHIYCYYICTYMCVCRKKKKCITKKATLAIMSFIV